MSPHLPPPPGYHLNHMGHTNNNREISQQNRMAAAPTLAEARVAFFACNGVALGGPQYRCVETARALTARGVPTICVTNCGRPTLEQLRGRQLDGIVFVKTVPNDFGMLRSVVRPATRTLLLDAADLNPGFQKVACRDERILKLFDGTIVHTQTSWEEIRKQCPLLGNRTDATALHYIEHFHLVTRRISDGSRWPKPSESPPRALLLMEHRVFPTESAFCKPIEAALPPTMRFDCHPLWGGPNAHKSRVNFFSGKLAMNVSDVERHLEERGAAELFTATYAKYDLLLQWYETRTSQRLINALATGLPVVALTNTAFEEAVAGAADVLLVHNHSELAAETRRLAASRAYRRRVSDAGFAVAERFSVSSITARYMAALGLKRRASGRSRPPGVGTG